MTSGTSTQVLIVGGGLGGLILAILLQRAGIDYFILEQSVIIRPIGTNVVLSALVLPLMEQLGLLEEIESRSLPFGGLHFWRDDSSFAGKVIVNNTKILDQKERYGHYDQCIPRPDLHNILLSRIPKHRIKLGKRLVNFQHIRTNSSNDSGLGDSPTLDSKLSSPSERVMVRCSDGTYYYGDVLVGADGASSAVRQSLFRQMKEEGTLPKVDQEEQQYRQVSLLGVTNPLNSRKHPDLKETFSNFKIILNRNSPYMSWFMPIRGNRYSWIVTRTLETPVTINSGNSALSEWGPEATDEMTKAVRHLVGPDNASVGDLIDNTDRQLIYKIMLEERIFRTWYGGRTVLIGDACHKCTPFTGKGASESMLDAVVLASLLYDMPSSPSSSPSLPSFKDFDALQQVFCQYYQTRSNAAKESVETSSVFSSLLVRDGWAGNLMRKIAFALNGGWVGRTKMDRIYFHRIQASFLPPVPDRGISPCGPHVPSRRPMIVYYKNSVDNDGSEGNGRLGGEGGLRESGEDKVLEYARVDEFLTGTTLPGTTPL
ncbi:hypothetical protein BGX27_010101 [Mortierella sp. AM989]|nr:hypothetical protein BGX27_010101 [Mortierella sp. AM989]